VGAHSGQTREALLVAAHEVMAEKGYPRVTLREVAERAGVQPALVNYYFGGKDGLLRSVIASVAGQMRFRIEQTVTGQGTPEERIRQLVDGIVQAMTAAPYAPRLMAEQVFFAEAGVIGEFVENFARPNLAAIRSLLEDGREMGSLRAVDPRFLVPALVGACIFFFLAAPIVRRLYGIEEIDAEMAREFADRTAELILYGIAVPGGAKA
jgi:AcrR family transcriptional regulator